MTYQEWFEEVDSSWRSHDTPKPSFRDWYWEHLPRHIKTSVLYPPIEEPGWLSNFEMIYRAAFEKAFDQKRISDILDEVKLDDPSLLFRVGDGWIQLCHRDSLIGSGRKWRWSVHMTKSEIVQTAFMAYLAWVEHEARESFTYKGEKIFSPHFDVDYLALLCSAEKFDVRDETSTPQRRSDQRYDFDEE